MSNNKALQILRSQKNPTTGDIKDEVLLDGQLFYSKDTKQLYIGDNSTKIQNLNPIGAIGFVSHSKYGAVSLGPEGMDPNAKDTQSNLLANTIDITDEDYPRSAQYSLVIGQKNHLKGPSEANSAGQGFAGVGNLISGIGNTVYSQASVVFGNNNIVNHTYGENGCLVAGNGNDTSAGLTFLLGNGLKSVNFNQTIVGKYNSTNNSAFIVGNGTADNARSNAFEVKKDGSAKIFGSLELENSTNSQSIRKRFMACAARELKNSKGYLDGFIVIYPESDLSDHLMATYDISFCPYSGSSSKLGIKASVNAYVFKEANKDALVYMGSADTIGSLSNIGNDIKPKIMIAYSKDRAGYFIVLGGPASVWRYHLGLSCDITVTNNLTTIPKFGIKLVQSLDEMITYYNDLNKEKNGYTPITELTTYEIPDSMINRLDSLKTPADPYDLIRYQDIAYSGSGNGQLNLMSQPVALDSLDKLYKDNKWTQLAKSTFTFTVTANDGINILGGSNTQITLPRYSKGTWISNRNGDIVVNFTTLNGCYYNYFCNNDGSVWTENPFRVSSLTFPDTSNQAIISGKHKLTIVAGNDGWDSNTNSYDLNSNSNIDIHAKNTIFYSPVKINGGDLIIRNLKLQNEKASISQTGAIGGQSLNINSGKAGITSTGVLSGQSLNINGALISVGGDATNGYTMTIF